MNKTDLVKVVAQKADMTQKDVEKVITHMLGSISDALVDNEAVQLIGFGTFEVKTRDERKGRNPQTGAEITIAASKNPTFKAGKCLKEAVNA